MSDYRPFSLPPTLTFVTDVQRNLVKVQNGRATVKSQTRGSSYPAGTRYPQKESIVSHPQLTGSRTRSVDLSAARTALWFAATVFLALLALYFVGVDQGAVSLFGSDSHVHEFVHDARHLLGFPCH